MSYLAGPAVPNVYAKSRHRTASASSTASLIGETRYNAEIAARHQAITGVNWEYASDAIASLRSIRPLVVAETSSSRDTTLSPTITHDDGEHFTELSVTPMQKEAYEVLRTYVEHKITKKKRVASGKREIEVGKKLEVIENAFPDFEPYRPLFEHIRLANGLPCRIPFSYPIRPRLNASSSSFSTAARSMESLSSSQRPYSSMSTTDLGIRSSPRSMRSPDVLSRTMSDTKQTSKTESISSGSFVNPPIITQEVALPPPAIWNPNVKASHGPDPTLDTCATSCRPEESQAGSVHISWPVSVQKNEDELATGLDADQVNRETSYRKKLYEWEETQAVTLKRDRVLDGFGVEFGVVPAMGVRATTPQRPPRPEMERIRPKQPDWKGLPPVPPIPSSHRSKSSSPEGPKSALPIKAKTPEPFTNRIVVPAGPSDFRIPPSPELLTPDEAREIRSSLPIVSPMVIDLSDTFEADMFGATPPATTVLAPYLKTAAGPSLDRLGPSIPLPALPSESHSGSSSSPTPPGKRIRTVQDALQSLHKRSSSLSPDDSPSPIPSPSPPLPIITSSPNTITSAISQLSLWTRTSNGRLSDLVEEDESINTSSSHHNPGLSSSRHTKRSSADSRDVLNTPESEMDFMAEFYGVDDASDDLFYQAPANATKRESGALHGTWV